MCVFSILAWKLEPQINEKPMKTEMGKEIEKIGERN